MQPLIRNRTHPAISFFLTILLYCNKINVGDKNMKAVDNNKDFLKELSKGKKKIGVTNEFYDYLVSSIPLIKEKPNIPISSYSGIDIYIKKDKKTK